MYKGSDMNDDIDDLDVDTDSDYNKTPDIGDVGIYIFADEFNSSSSSKAIKFILSKNILAKKKRPGNLTLIINSPGGELSSAFALIDIMKGSKIPVHTLGIGEISSCGLLTFMAGEKGHRIITPNTSILSHQYSWGSYGKEHELIARVKEYNNTSERMLAHYKKCTGLSEKVIKEILMPPEDVWLSAKEAVKYGIADQIKSTY
jgi:ATP-dependent Clp protease protease subunit